MRVRIAQFCVCAGPDFCRSLVIEMPSSAGLLRADGNEARMTEIEYARKLDELDRLLNDPDVPMEPAKVWSLLAELSRANASGPPAPAAVARPVRS